MDMDFLQLDLADPQTRGPIASTINSTNDASLVDKYVVETRSVHCLCCVNYGTMKLKKAHAACFLRLNDFTQ